MFASEFKNLKHGKRKVYLYQFMDVKRDILHQGKTWVRCI